MFCPLNNNDMLVLNSLKKIYLKLLYFSSSTLSSEETCGCVHNSCSVGRNIAATEANVDFTLWFCQLQVYISDEML